VQQWRHGKPEPARARTHRHRHDTHGHRGNRSEPCKRMQSSTQPPTYSAAQPQPRAQADRVLHRAQPQDPVMPSLRPPLSAHAHTHAHCQDTRMITVRAHARTHAHCQAATERAARTQPRDATERAPPPQASRAAAATSRAQCPLLQCQSEPARGASHPASCGVPASGRERKQRTVERRQSAQRTVTRGQWSAGSRINDAQRTVGRRQSAQPSSANSEARIVSSHAQRLQEQQTVSVQTVSGRHLGAAQYFSRAEQQTVRMQTVSGRQSGAAQYRSRAEQTASRCSLSTAHNSKGAPPLTLDTCAPAAATQYAQCARGGGSVPAAATQDACAPCMPHAHSHARMPCMHAQGAEARAAAGHTPIAARGQAARRGEEEGRGGRVLVSTCKGREGRVWNASVHRAACVARPSSMQTVRCGQLDADSPTRQVRCGQWAADSEQPVGSQQVADSGQPVGSGQWAASEQPELEHGRAMQLRARTRTQAQPATSLQTVSACMPAMQTVSVCMQIASARMQARTLSKIPAVLPAPPPPSLSPGHGRANCRSPSRNTSASLRPFRTAGAAAGSSTARGACGVSSELCHAESPGSAPASARAPACACARARVRATSW
jgi:hypothetical protein